MVLKRVINKICKMLCVGAGKQMRESATTYGSFILSLV